jgi:hypothetical protein
MQTSKNRIAHVARLESPKDVSSTVRSWIKKSYQLTAGNDKS